jgi:hypothetical protein
MKQEDEAGRSMFEVHEERLQAMVKQAETPVLGLLGTLLPDVAREAIRKDLAIMPSARAYSQRLQKYPALFGVWLAEHVMLGLGQDGHFSLYPHLQKAIGVSTELTFSERELLWRAFRRAMFKLGIQPLSRVFGTHFMADEYVRQAGVPIAFADDLAVRMLQAAKRVGLPDEDDQEGLLTWQSNLLNKLVPPFSVTARKAVERDTIGYYTRAFVRVHLNGGQATGKDPLEQAFGKAFAVGGASHLRRAAIPQLLYRDGALGVLFPPADRAVSYKVECGGQIAPIRLDSEGGFRALPAGLHREVVVQRDDGERVLSVRLWPDSMNNKLLIFNAEGRLRASAGLGQENPVELAPGRYLALCRFEPSNAEDWYEVSESPLLVEVHLEIRPGVELLIKNGPASVALVGQNQPSLSLSGPSKGGLEGLEFWYGDIDAHIEVPADWLQNSTGQFEVRVVHGNRRASLPMRLEENRRAIVKLSEAIAQLDLGGGLWRLVLELGRAGEARAAQRQSALYWSSLRNVSYGLKFLYESPPKNLITSSCYGIVLSPTQMDPADDHSRLIRLSFDVGGGRLVHFSWHRPGVFVEVRMPAADGSTASIARPLGAAETVSLTSPKTIVVSASEPGYLSLGSMRTFVDFSQKASKAFPASFLASRLEPGARALKYETASGTAAVELLVLSQPHVATDVKTERLANLFEVRLVVNSEPTDVAVTGRELSTGHEARAEHELLAGAWYTNDLARMQVYAAPAGQSHVIHVLIDVETLKPGIWLLGFGARIGGVWGRLQDGDEGRIAVAFAVDIMGKEIPGKEVVAAADALALSDAAVQLARLNEHFRQCWSPVCWEQQQWLTPYFSALVDRLRDNEKDYVTELVDMAMCRPPEDGRPGYLSMQFAPAWLNHTFSQQRATYKRVNIKPHPLSIALRAMVELKGAVAPAFGTVLHPIAAMPFANIAEVMRGRRPKGFSVETYREALQQTKLEGAYQLDDELFLPNEGELLGPLHLAQCWRDLERGFAYSQIMPNNRKNAALALAKKLGLHRSAFDQSVSNGLKGQPLLLRFGKPHDDQLDDGEQLKWEHMEHVALAVAWLAWFCRLDHRQPGVLSGFHSQLGNLRKQVEVPGGTVADCVAFYLQVAPAIFAFYLLLWELVQTTELDPAVQNV